MPTQVEKEFRESLFYRSLFYIEGLLWKYTHFPVNIALRAPRGSPAFLGYETVF